MTGTRYTYGTTEAAAGRLETIAAFFNPRSAEFVRKQARGKVASALDLGCGPGYSTEMLARALPAAKVYGLDKSSAFLAMARRRCPDLTFLEHDVTDVPFPVRPAVIYCRFLLSHLRDATLLVDRLAGELEPEGVLLCEETEAVHTDVTVFQRYLGINADLIRSQGAELFVGQSLAKGRYSHEVALNEVEVMPVTNSLAATWFFPNSVTVWEQEKSILRSVPPSERRAISAELARLRDSGSTRRDIVWHIRRLALRCRNNSERNHAPRRDNS